MANDGYVTLLHEVATRTLPLSRLEPVIGQERYDRLISAGDRLKNRLGERTVWNINSTAVGGGVAEMLQVVVGYVAGFGIPIRWLTIGGDPVFFGITKRLHNQIHGAAEGPLPDGRTRLCLHQAAVRPDMGAAGQAVGHPAVY